MADYAIANFNMSYADLITTCNTIHASMVRDASEFLNYGVLAPEMLAFHTLINEFELLPSDIVLEAHLVNATQAKDAIANDLRIMLRSFDTRAKLAFTTEAGTYKEFHTRTLSQISDNNLLVFGRMVKQAADEFLVQLTPFGMSQLLIDELDTKNQDFEDAIAAQKAAIANRDNSTNNRVKKANALYALLMKYCEIGKTIWYEVNEAKYNDYVIFGGGGGGGSVPDNPPGIPEIGKTSTGLFFGEVPTATSYQLMYKLVEASTFDEMYNGPYTSEIQPYPPDAGSYVAKVRARNAAGYGEFSAELSFNCGIQPTILISVDYQSVEKTIVATWQSVPNATSYDVYESVVPLGNPPSTFTFVPPTVYGTAYTSTELTVFNTTHHIYIITRNGAEQSLQSNIIPVNVPNPV